MDATNCLKPTWTMSHSSLSDQHLGADWNSWIKWDPDWGIWSGWRDWSPTPDPAVIYIQAFPTVLHTHRYCQLLSVTYCMSYCLNFSPIAEDASWRFVSHTNTLFRRLIAGDYRVTDALWINPAYQPMVVSFVCSPEQETDLFLKSGPVRKSRRQ